MNVHLCGFIGRIIVGMSEHSCDCVVDRDHGVTLLLFVQCLALCVLIKKGICVILFQCEHASIMSALRCLTPLVASTFFL